MSTIAGREVLPPRFPLRYLAAAAILVLALPGHPSAAVIEGLASFRGVVQAGVAVRVLSGPDLAPALSSAPAAVTGSDGRFRLEIKPGTWYLAAHRKEKGSRPALEPGDLYSFYNGNPVQATAAEPTRVVFNLVRIPADGEPVKGLTGIEGELRFDDKLLGRAYLYVYQDAADGFRGMGFQVAPVGPEGRFRLKLPPGRYYLIARQRREGGMLGPLKKNDRAGFYHGNPLTVAGNEARRIVLELTERVEQEEEMAPQGGAFRVIGVVRGPGGKPEAGLRVLAHDMPDATGRPRFVSGVTGPSGRYELELPKPVTVYLTVRQNLGGPAEEKELAGRHQDGAGRLRPVTVGGTTPLVTVDLSVSPSPAR